MGLDHAATKPHDALAAILASDMNAVNTLIRERMASRHAPRIPIAALGWSLGIFFAERSA